LKRLVLIFIIANSIGLFGQNLLNNGTFEYGGSGYGFAVDGAGYNQLSTPYSGFTAPGNYAIVNNPHIINNLSFLNSGDHTSGDGLMLVFDGNTLGNQERFWKAGEAGLGICNLTPGNSYTFSYWIRTVTNGISGNNELADINVAFTNAENVNLDYGTTLAPLPNFGWVQVRYTFTASNACINIELFNNNISNVGNDFAIDDMSLVENKPLSFNYSITQVNCSEENSGVIFIYPTGGVEPFTFGAGSQIDTLINTTGILSGLEEGNYVIGLRDATGLIDSISSISLSNQSPITINPNDTIVCPNSILSFTANNGESTYTWTSSPNDLELINNNQPSIEISPNITTTYTATSQVNNINLIYNGDFELGDVGFLSDYRAKSSNLNELNRTYGVVTNSSFWNPAMGNCIDHSFGNSSGKMLVVCGSTYNAGTDVLWKQKIAVEQNKSYDFSFWLQTLELSNAAEIKVYINDVLVSSNLAIDQVCVWNQYVSNWNSGSDSIAEIKLINKTFSSVGNSFSIDDLVFKTQNNCSKSVSVTMKTENPDFGLAYPSNLCLNNPPISPTTGPDYVSGGIYNVIQPGLNIDNLTGLVTLSNGTSVGPYEITYTAQVCGQYIPDTFLVNVRSLPSLQSFTGGEYLCETKEFAPLILSVSGTPDWTIFYSFNDQPQILDSSSSSPISLGNAFGVYELDSIVDAYCSNAISGSQTISIDDAPTMPIINGKTEYCRNDFSEALTISNINGIVNWYLDSNLTDFIGNNPELLPSTQSTQIYFATQTVNNCEGSAASILVTINDCNLIIPSAFTPNSDGDNDTWNISQLDELYPENIVWIFNRWGEPIFESAKGKYSETPWNGKFKEAMLPVGTYYYLIQRSDDNSIEPLNGIVTLILKK
jgi:gliding motility-associated-like protein